MKRRTFIKIVASAAALPAMPSLAELPPLPETEPVVGVDLGKPGTDKTVVTQMRRNEREQWEIELFGEWHAFDVEPNEDGELRSVTELRMYATQTGRLPDALWFRGPNGEHGQASFEWTSQNAVLGDTIAIEPGAVSITAV